MTTTPDANAARAPLAVGTRVEVLTGFDGSWTGGFSVAGHDGDRYRIRRRSDDVELPVTFPPEAVRRAPRPMWWV